MRRLINKKAVRALALETVDDVKLFGGKPKFVRVSKEFLESIESVVKDLVAVSARGASSRRGRTL